MLCVNRTVEVAGSINAPGIDIFVGVAGVTLLSAGI